MKKIWLILAALFMPTRLGCNGGIALPHTDADRAHLSDKKKITISACLFIFCIGMSLFFAVGASAQPKVEIGDWTVEYPDLDVQGDQQTARDFVGSTLKSDSYVDTHLFSESLAVTPIKASKTLKLSGSPLGWTVRIRSHLSGHLCGLDITLGSVHPASAVSGIVTVNPGNNAIIDSHDSFSGPHPLSADPVCKSVDQSENIAIHLSDGEYVLDAVLTTYARIDQCFTCGTVTPVYAISNFYFLDENPHAGFFVEIEEATPISDKIACGDTDALTRAIEAANINGTGADTIDLNPRNQGNCTYTLTAAFDSANQDGLPMVSGNLTINGNGAIIERSDAAGTPDFRIFDVTEGGNLTLRNLTVRNGRVSAAGIGGGGIQNLGTVRLFSSTIQNNVTTDFSQGGGGIYNLGEMTITNSTIKDNKSTLGAGIFNIFAIIGPGKVSISKSTISNNSGGAGAGIFNSGEVIMTNSTITQNTGFEGTLFNNGQFLFAVKATLQNSTVTDNNGGGISNTGTVQLLNTMVAAQSSGKDCSGSITSLGHNLDSDGTCGLDAQKGDLPKTNPGFDSFLDSGAPGEGRFPLKQSSPAVDAGANDGCPPADQLDRRRPIDGGGFQGDGIATCDIGAVEFYPKINVAVHFEDDPSTYRTVENTDGCPSGSQGKFTFTAKLQGEREDVPPLSDLFVQVFMLTNDNLLIGDRGPGGVGAIMTIAKRDQYSDGILEKTEFVDVPFTICLKAIKQRFNFFVDVYGNVKRAN